MKKTTVELYLDLMKKTLSFMLWPEPPIPMSFYYNTMNPVKKTMLSAVQRLLKMKDLMLVHNISYSPKQKREGSITCPGNADTMIGIKRLDNIQHCVETVINEGIEGDLIETGVWRGGACIFMRAVLAAYGIVDRKVYLADSFEGLPKPDTERFPEDEGDDMHTKKYFVVSREDVENNFRKYNLLDDQVVFLQGWFKDTLAIAPMKKLSVLRLDGDMYSSTMDALKYLYPNLSTGGFCIIDDYGCLGSCRKAVDDFRKQNGIQAEIKEIDWTGIYWRKD